MKFLVGLMRRNNPNILKWWLFGAIGSFFVIWGLSFFFLDTIRPIIYYPELQLHAPPAGTVYRYRDEGGGTTVYGKYGIPGIPDVGVLDGEKICIWGDSHVEALQVDDKDKPGQVLTRLLQEKGYSNSVGVGVARSGESVADYVFRIPLYENVIGHVQAHVILLSGIDDVMPDQDRSCHSRFDSTPQPSLTFSECFPSDTAIQYTPFLYETGTSFLYEIYNQLRNLHIRIAPGPVVSTASAAGEPQQMNGERLKDAWRFLLGELKAVTTAPIIFLYVPPSPPGENLITKFDDPDRPYVDAFSSLCNESGVGFVDSSQQYKELYDDLGLLPRGFDNTRPGLGHLNKQGLKVVTEVLAQYLMENGYVVLPN
ncbi:hypothetical protein [Pseudodesulfovibrio sp. zrk46]|uniref:hypothetical protein n=1 Tax=Pseudodesulfovibrio sp. zrk46 TaxID=2725288 RepID=UPI001448B74E|nr:hypothetical protein [Pseudodesulfovibrio sp. zrk46]QJB56594.1 hypothetical protein HFN16_09310 [Pseudodesulfovibrio sp. zrk46]